ncbi:MAG TPA: hypothetical protein VLA42_06965 [Verrucomicrobiae bacterium]|nr:hypothetical protein [Verrucomicrobiae bacterium]
MEIAQNFALKKHWRQAASFLLRGILAGACCTGVLLVLMSSASALVGAQSNARPGDSSSGVQTQMQNVMFHFSEAATAYIKTLSGELLPNEGSEFPVFDNKESFRLRIGYAEIDIAAGDLASVFNWYVFARASSPLKGVSMSIENGHLKIKGNLHDVGTIPFETESTLSPTDDGKILLRMGKVKALHVPVKGIMNLFGVEIADLIKNGKLPGVEARGDDLVLDPSLVFPTPHMEGRVTETRIEGNTIVLTFGDKNRAPKARQAGNYISFRGNRLRFGKLTMTDVDMTLIDMDPTDPFDFFLDRYKDQIAAGYSKISSNSALRIFVKDFNKLGKSKISAKGSD